MESCITRRVKELKDFAKVSLEKGEERQFEGIVKGQITREKRGESGFGYDPIFQPDGYETTFAELGSDIKNRISHRARAVAALCDYLRKNNY